MSACALCKAAEAEQFDVAGLDTQVALCAVCRDGAEVGPTDAPQGSHGQVVGSAELLEVAKAGLPDENAVVHRDSNGTILQAGDTVTLIKALPVKGAGFTAKQGTAVRKISLEMDNPEHIAGRVEGQRIVILTKFVKKS